MLGVRRPRGRLDRVTRAYFDLVEGLTLLCVPVLAFSLLFALLRGIWHVLRSFVRLAG
jgi:hypothetical protein